MNNCILLNFMLCPNPVSKCTYYLCSVVHNYYEWEPNEVKSLLIHYLHISTHCRTVKYSFLIGTYQCSKLSQLVKQPKKPFGGAEIQTFILKCWWLIYKPMEYNEIHVGDFKKNLIMFFTATFTSYIILILCILAGI